ncbi:SEC-C domain-containing protein [Candidatus Uhrbacteria bacterium]|nr:SEC-C domain-containing protein [Candidatus Uhrbacteria bacterium]
MPHPYSQLSAELKKKCVEYVVLHLKNDFEVSPTGQSYQELCEEMDPFLVDKDHLYQLLNAHIDTFLLFCDTQNGKRVLEVLRETLPLTDEEKDVLIEWRDQAFYSVFEIRGTTPVSLQLQDLVSEAEYEVYVNQEATPTDILNGDKTGHFISSNMAPVHGVWFLSGTQHLLPAMAEEHIFTAFVQQQSPDTWYRHNPKRLEKAFQVQKEHYDCFVSVFGIDELFGSGRDVATYEQTYFEAWCQKVGQTSPPPLGERDGEEEFLHAKDVGLVMEEREGLHRFLNYGAFVRVFADVKPLSSPARALVTDYLEDDSLPAFVFRRMRDRYTDRFREVIRCLVPSLKMHFDPVADFTLLMDTYKPGWHDVYPSMHPMSERALKHYYHKTDIGRNDLCPCQSGCKYKKCHGR